MTTYSRVLLSASTNGLPTKITATSIASGTTIHTATATSGAFDEIYIWLTNTDTVDHSVTIGWGGVTDPDNLVSKTVTVPKNSGPTPYIPGLILAGGLIVKMSADLANMINASGYVNRIAP